MSDKEHTTRYTVFHRPTTSAYWELLFTSTFESEEEASTVAELYTSDGREVLIIPVELPL